MKSISKEKRFKVYSIFNGKCAYCGCPIDLKTFHIDHINPLFRGLSQEQMNRIGYNRTKGTNHIENLYPSCPSCNCSKRTYTIEEWRNVIELKKELIKKNSADYNFLLKFGCVIETNKSVEFYFETL